MVIEAVVETFQNTSYTMYEWKVRQGRATLAKCVVPRGHWWDAYDDALRFTRMMAQAKVEMPKPPKGEKRREARPFA